ncbi:hypothetical protein N566_21790 [Streptomycetaceae bacterium MP113-05]|nr:hypothetical protein N566_21790 [Streptomycetaceae bacterium MP113-05]
MSAEERDRDRPRGWRQSPSMSELLASCAAADAVSKPPQRPAAVPTAAEEDDARRGPAPLDAERRDAA